MGKRNKKAVKSVTKDSPAKNAQKLTSVGDKISNSKEKKKKNRSKEIESKTGQKGYFLFAVPVVIAAGVVAFSISQNSSSQHEILVKPDFRIIPPKDPIHMETEQGVVEKIEKLYPGDRESNQEEDADSKPIDVGSDSQSYPSEVLENENIVAPPPINLETHSTEHGSEDAFRNVYDEDSGGRSTTDEANLPLSEASDRIEDDVSEDAPENDEDFGNAATKDATDSDAIEQEDGLNDAATGTVETKRTYNDRNIIQTENRDANDASHPADETIEHDDEVVDNTAKIEEPKQTLNDQNVLQNDIVESDEADIIGKSESIDKTIGSEESVRNSNLDEEKNSSQSNADNEGLSEVSGEQNIEDERVVAHASNEQEEQNEESDDEARDSSDEDAEIDKEKSLEQSDESRILGVEESDLNVVRDDNHEKVEDSSVSEERNGRRDEESNEELSTSVSDTDNKSEEKIGRTVISIEIDVNLDEDNRDDANKYSDDSGDDEEEEDEDEDESENEDKSNHGQDNGKPAEPILEESDDEYIEVTKGVTKWIIREGTGQSIEPGDIITIHCIGYLDEKPLKKFWSTKDPSQRAFTFTAGKRQVIKGWDEGALSMSLHERSRIKIEPKKAYGKFGFEAWGIPPGARIILEMEVIEHKRMKSR